MHPQILRQVFDLSQQQQIAEILSRRFYRPCPAFLGHFDYSKFTNIQGLGSELIEVILLLSSLVPSQEFNTVFIQRYLAGAFVAGHRDPRNNLDKTVVSIFGHFDGAISQCADFRYRLDSGDVAIQDCTINGEQGPYHSVDSVTSGVRYAIILNTIRY
jgi:hypothetical protein